MFCGWRLANSYKDLERLGSGTLIIDVLAGSCLFDGLTIEPPNIAWELRSWLCEDLAAQGIPVGALLRAGLTARLSITAGGSRPRDTPVHFLGADGKPIRSGEFYRCEVVCESEVATDEAGRAGHEDFHSRRDTATRSARLAETAGKPKALSAKTRRR